MKPERTPQKELKIQLLRLESSCREYDNGTDVSALNISVALRTLLYDKGYGISVLKQCGILEDVKLFDSTAPCIGMSFFNIGDNVSNVDILYSGDIYAGLVSKDIHNGGEGELVYHFSPLCASPVYSGYRKGLLDQNRSIPIKDWLDAPVFRVNADTRPIQMTREEIFLRVANKEGGAHFDPNPTITKNGIQSLDPYSMFLDDTQAIHLMVNGVDVYFENTPVFPSLRQMAEEVLISLSGYLRMLN